MEHKFKDEDKDSFIEFLNFIATKAEFNMNTQEALKYVKLLSTMEKVILPKIDANIFEIKEIKNNKKDK
jgi:hypothetical protein